MAASSTEKEDSGASGSTAPAPSPSQDQPRRMPEGKRFPKTDDETEAKIAALQAKVAAQAKEITELRDGLHRLAEATGRTDVLLAPATAEEIKAAYNAGAQLRVLTNITRGTINLQAGRTIAARHFPLEAMMDLARIGLLRVAVLPSSRAA